MTSQMVTLDETLSFAHRQTARPSGSAPAAGCRRPPGRPRRGGPRRRARRRFQVAADVTTDEHGATVDFAAPRRRLRQLVWSLAIHPSAGRVPPFPWRRACWRGATSPSPCFPARCRPRACRSRARTRGAVPGAAGRPIACPTPRAAGPPARSSRGPEAPGMTADERSGSSPARRVPAVLRRARRVAARRIPGAGRPPAGIGRAPRSRGRTVRGARGPRPPRRTQQWLSEARADRVLVLTSDAAGWTPTSDSPSDSISVREARGIDELVREVQKFGRIDVILALLPKRKLPDGVPDQYDLFSRLFLYLRPGGTYIVDRTVEGDARSGSGVEPVAPAARCRRRPRRLTSGRPASPRPSAPSSSRATWCW